MPRPARHVIGATYGRLTLLKIVQRGTDLSTKGMFKCACGNMHTAFLKHVLKGTTSSCGCYHRERAAEVTKKRATKHGMYYTRVYTAWRSLLGRCLNTHHRAYPHYGGRGITICERWTHFENFYADMGDPPKGLSLDRIDNERGYSKDNCRWATNKEQQNNKRTNRRITYRGKTQTLTQWAEELGMKTATLYSRITQKQWPVARALTEPVRAHRSTLDLPKTQPRPSNERIRKDHGGIPPVHVRGDDKRLARQGGRQDRA